ncbi:MAG: glycosyltransferase, partial [Chloroflexota bacterium]
MNLSVVIVNYNTCDLLRDCLQSLIDSTITSEVIVVDNASSDGSATMVTAEFPEARLLAQTENIWFC